ncbi:LysM peptidoglycan-binding domain-containing protein [Lignipirellula cremea]|uniref:LysM domain/BON superfamily protein n=1 Tax=Lignipirellula cremea TaxID=2528010 RepID=A0A518E188_9BACT|nr:LysM peptidoglycan-binding domain-containing protein [Lignipirellula cremea]QDU97859.1 LysM domain/BON superfamily protein [Lignipirellula cremea]
MNQPQKFQTEVRLGMAVLVLLVIGLGAAAWRRFQMQPATKPLAAATSVAPQSANAGQRPSTSIPANRLLADHGATNPDTNAAPAPRSGGSFTTFRENYTSDTAGAAASSDQLPSPRNTLTPASSSSRPPAAEPPSAFSPRTYPVQPAANHDAANTRPNAAPAAFEAPVTNPPGGAFNPYGGNARPTGAAAIPSTDTASEYAGPAAGPVHPASASLPLPAPRAFTAGQGLPPAQTLPNDSFWMISERAYGTGVYFKALYQHNRDQFPYPDRLPTGAPLQIPPLAELQVLYPDLCPEPEAAAPKENVLPEATRRRLYSVRNGDTLYEIARRELGEGSRWTDIYRLNQAKLGDRYDNLPVDMQLVLPE